MWRPSRPDRSEASRQGDGLWVFFGALAVPLQSVIAPLGAMGGVFSDLPMVVVVLFALTHRRVASVTVGALTGALVDALSADPSPFHLVTFAVVAFVAGSVGRLTANVRLVTTVTVVAACSIGVGVAYAVTGPPVARGDVLLRWLGTDLVFTAVYNAGIGACLFTIWTWWHPPARQAVGERDELFSSGRFQGLIR